MRPKKIKTRPSAANRWIPCPGSAWVDMAVDAQPVTLDKAGKPILPPGRASSPYAAEGTMGHAVLSSSLTGEPVSSFLRDDDDRIALPDEDIDLIETMAEIIKGLVVLNGFEMHVETLMSIRFDVVLDSKTSKAVNHTIWGKADVILVNDTQIMVLDYKHGAGVPVRVEQNPQLTLYGLMALEKYPGRALTIGVIQPRGRGKGVDLWDCTPEYLNDFDKTVKAAIRKIYDPFPAFNPGPWCKEFCLGMQLGACPAMLERALKYAVGVEGVEPEHLTSAWWLLDWAESVEKVAGKLKDEALAYAKRGGKLPGWSLGSKAGFRRWREPDEIAHVLAELTGDEPETFMKAPAAPRPVGIAEALRHPKLKGQNLDKYVVKPINDVLVREAETLELFDDVVDEKEREQ